MQTEIRDAIEEALRLMRMEVASALKVYMEERCVSMELIAQRLGCSENHVRRILNASTNRITLSELAAIATLIGRSVSLYFESK